MHNLNIKIIGAYLKINPELVNILYNYYEL